MLRLGRQIVLLHMQMSLSLAVANAVSEYVSEYDVSWSSSAYGGARYGTASMPTGNGDAAANLWWDDESEAIVALLAKGDAWSQWHDLLKVGRVSIKLKPSPGKLVKQTFHLADASVEMKWSDGTSAHLWLDAHNNVLRGSIVGTSPSTLTMEYIPIRTRESAYDPGYDFYCNFSKQSAGLQEDVFDTHAAAQSGRLLWHYRNADSTWKGDLAHQGLGGAEHLSRDPFINLTFGGFANITSGPASRLSPTYIQSDLKHRSHEVEVWLLTNQTDTAAEWEEQILLLAQKNAQHTVQNAYAAHSASWSEFWSRSWIRMGPANPWDGGDTSDNSTSAWEVSRRWHLQRAVHGMLGKGKYPIKFNGNLFTIGSFVGSSDGHNITDPDFRAYGGYYWHQNTRQSYWSMLGSGDYSLMAPFFNMYTNNLPLLKERSQRYWRHQGVVFPETLSVYGLFPQSSCGYGCDQRDGGQTGSPTAFPKPVWFIQGRYIRYHYNSAIEVTAAMLEYYYHTLDRTFATAQLMPFAREVMKFFLAHYQEDLNGKLVIMGQALETWQNAINPSEQIAGILSTIEGLLSLPQSAGIVSDKDKALLQTLKQRMPGLTMCNTSLPHDRRSLVDTGSCKPIDTSTSEVVQGDQYTYLCHAEYWSRNSNIENPELYPVFPYKLFTRASAPDQLAIGIETYKRRKFPGDDTSEWQDVIQAALLGMVNETKRLVVGRLGRGGAQMRFPGFYGVMADANWVPDEGHASILKLSLQYMLMFDARPKLIMFSAWPIEWDVDFKLHAEGNTTIEAACVQGNLTKLVVTPKSREADLIFAQAYCKPN